MEWISLLVYIGGAVVMALVIRVTTPPGRLDRGAALVACIIWPCVLVVGVLALLAFGWMEIFFPDTEHEAG